MTLSEDGHGHKGHVQKHTALWLIVTVMILCITVPALLIVLTIHK